MSKFLIRFLALGWLIWLAAAAFGAETGTLRGTVRDASNQTPLEGVQVQLEGPALPGGRSRTTDARGSYWFPVLPPGEYHLNFLKDGYQTRTIDATVRLDQTTSLPVVDLPLVNYTSETIEIVETAPMIDNTKSSVGETVGEDYFSKLPVARSYQGVIATLPGVSGRIDYQNGGPGDGNPSVRGEGRYGNNYLLEGFSIRDPLTKTTGLNLPFDAIQEISILTDGAPAEFGDFTGMVANILLKSGSNETHGTLQYFLDAPASFGQYEILATDPTGTAEDASELKLRSVDKRRSFFQTPVLTLGGPIVKDKLWFFTAADVQTGSRQFEGATVATKTAYNYRFLTRFTYNPFTDSSSLINFTIQKQGARTENAGADSLTAPEATTNGFTDVLSLNANLKTVLSPYVVLEAKWNRASTAFHNELTSTDLFTPSHTIRDTGYVFGNVPYLYSTLRDRQGMAFHLTRYLTEALGQHVVKGGYEYHSTSNEDEFTYTGGPGVEGAPAIQYLDKYLYDENGAIIGVAPYKRYEYYNVGPLGHAGSNNVFFLQDQWQPITNLTLNLGLRLDTESLQQNAGRTVVDQYAFAPRFGLAWDVLGDSNNLVSANAGRYFDVNGLAFADWGDTRTSNHFTLCRWDEATQDYTKSCFTQDPVANPATYDKDLQPYYLDKFTLGYTRAVNALIAVGIKGIVSTTRDMPEDAQQTPGIWTIVNPDLKRRDYWAIELTAERHFADNWQLLTSFTYSQSKGTSPGSFEAGSSESSGGEGNQVGVFMDNISDPFVRGANAYFTSLEEAYDFGGLGYNSYNAFGKTYPGSNEGWYGFLPNHSFFYGKINGSYRFKWGTELGVVYEFDSGHAWQRRGEQDAYGGHLTFPEGRGSRFMPPVNYLDVRVAHEFHLPKNLRLSAELVIQNLLDLDTAISYYENFDNSDALAFENGRYVVGTDADGNPLYSNFGQPLYRQAPRALRASVKLTF